jgi:zinc transporter
VATVFLPPTLISGLLGINVAGIPGAQHPSYAFWLVCLILVVLAIDSTVIVARIIKE